jgi:hypothetical protein
MICGSDRVNGTVRWHRLGAELIMMIPLASDATLTVHGITRGEMISLQFIAGRIELGFITERMVRM